MLKTIEILRLRILLCFLNEDIQNCTVTGIARTLREEKYTISRALSSMEKEGIIDRKDKRNPKLTVIGKEEALRYAQRVEYITNHLTLKGIDPVDAQNDALHCAIFCSESTMQMIYDAQEQLILKQKLQWKNQFYGDFLSGLMKDGNYHFPFLIYKDSAEGGDILSMSNEGFENPCTLSVKNGEGTIHLRLKMISGKSAFTGKKMWGQLSGLKYYENGGYVQAEKRGNIISFPMSTLQFQKVTLVEGQMFHGSVRLKMKCSVDDVHMPESTAIFTISI